MLKFRKLKNLDQEILLLVQVKDGGEEELAQMLTGLVSAPKVLVERSGGHMLALYCSRF